MKKLLNCGFPLVKVKCSNCSHCRITGASWMIPLFTCNISTDGKTAKGGFCPRFNFRKNAGREAVLEYNRKGGNEI